MTIGQFYHTEDDELATRERSFLLGRAREERRPAHHAAQPAWARCTRCERLARELSSQYKVVYGRPESLIPPERIEVSARGARRDDAWYARARRRVWSLK